MNNIDKATEILKNGGIVIFPTDTAFGIGCRIDDKDAVKKLFKIRRRPTTQATPVLVDSIEMAREYVESIPDDVLDLMNKYWPGALTIVLESRIDKTPSLVRGGGLTIGVRIPNNTTILEIIKKVGVPILGPSANFPGGATPYKFEDLDQNLVSVVDFVVHGDTSAGTVSPVFYSSVYPFKSLYKKLLTINF